MLMVGREHFVSGRELDAVRDEVHRLGRIAGEDEAIGVSTQQGGERLLEIVPSDSGRVRHGYATGVLGHRIDNDVWRRPQRTVVEIYAVRRDQELGAHESPKRLIRRCTARGELLCERFHRLRPRQRGSPQDGEKASTV